MTGIRRDADVTEAISFDDEFQEFRAVDLSDSPSCEERRLVCMTTLSLSESFFSYYPAIAADVGWQVPQLALTMG